MFSLFGKAKEIDRQRELFARVCALLPIREEALPPEVRGIFQARKLGKMSARAFAEAVALAVDRACGALVRSALHDDLMRQSDEVLRSGQFALRDLSAALKKEQKQNLSAILDLITQVQAERARGTLDAHWGQPHPTAVPSDDPPAAGKAHAKGKALDVSVIDAQIALFKDVCALLPFGLDILPPEIQEIFQTRTPGQMTAQAFVEAIAAAVNDACRALDSTAVLEAVGHKEKKEIMRGRLALRKIGSSLAREQKAALNRTLDWISKALDQTITSKKEAEKKEAEERAQQRDWQKEPKSAFLQRILQGRSDELIDDLSYVAQLRSRQLPSGVWYQYDILLAARPYGWDACVELAAYLESADLDNISTLTVAEIANAPTTELIDKYKESGGTIRDFDILSHEFGVLGLGGISRVIGAPVQIFWFNQTKVLRLDTILNDDELILRYVETLIRRTFGTDDAMRRAKTAAEMKAGSSTPKPAEAKKTAAGAGSMNEDDRQMRAYIDALHARIAAIGQVLPIDESLLSGESREYFGGERFPNVREAVRLESLLSVQLNFLCITINKDALSERIMHLPDDQLSAAYLALRSFIDVAPQSDKPELLLMYCDMIAQALQAHGSKVPEPQPQPVRIQGQSILIDMNAVILWKNANPSEQYYAFYDAVHLTGREPVLKLYENGFPAGEYCLQAEGDESFDGKYFQLSVRIAPLGETRSLGVQIDGFFSDTPDSREMTSDDIGYRIQTHFLPYNAAHEKSAQTIADKDLVMKGLKVPGYTTPTNVRMIGVCAKCGRSFAFHAYSFYMAQQDVAYSDEGLDVCVISDPQIDKGSWSYTEDGKVFRYYNSFNCPHCKAPYIDYKSYPNMKQFGVCGCVLLNRKAYYAK